MFKFMEGYHNLFHQVKDGKVFGNIAGNSVACVTQKVRAEEEEGDYPTLRRSCLRRDCTRA